jgi:hypothetical protein
MARITRKMADTMAARLNEVLGRPTETYVLDESTGTYKAQLGCIHLSAQNGAHNVYVMANEAGGCRGLAYGLTTREAYDWLSAALVGVQLADNR